MQSLPNAGIAARALDSLPVAALLIDPTGMIVGANQACRSTLGWDRGTLVDSPVDELCGPPVPHSSSMEFASAISKGRPWRGDLLITFADGDRSWRTVTCDPVIGADPARVIATFTDAASRFRPEDQVDPVSLVLEFAARLVAATDTTALASAVASTSSACGLGDVAVALAGGGRITVEAAAGSTFATLVGAGVRHSILASMARGGIAGVRSVRLGDLVLGDRPETADPEETLAVTPIVRNDRVYGALIMAAPNERIFEDVSLTHRILNIAALSAVAHDAVAASEVLHDAAGRDSLTGLLTRPSLERRLSAELAVHPSHDIAGTVHAALDRFRLVNETLGYDAGDELLRVLAGRIAEAAGPGALVARPAADEFIVSVANVAASAEVDALANDVQTAIRVPIDIGGQIVYPSASIGRSVAPVGEQRSSDESARGLLSAADRSMYRAKRLQRTRRPTASRDDLLALHADLYRAVSGGEIAAYFQPQYDITTSTLTGFEALARWDHEDRGHIPPDVFIPLAEEVDLIHDLGDLIRSQVRRFITDLGDPAMSIHVNVSSRELHRPGYAERFASTFGCDEILIASLVVEVTETALVHDVDTLARELLAIRALGAGIAVDDFGTGTSSLALLRDLPVTELKVDKAFLRSRGPEADGVLQTIVRLAEVLGLDLVAEGVEHRDQLALLRMVNCRRAQGYLFSPALPAPEALKLPRMLEPDLQ